MSESVLQGKNDEVDGGPGRAFAHFITMAEFLDKLKMLDYDTEFVLRLKMKPLNRYYFAIQTNPGEQFYLFSSLAVWLIRKCGKNLEQPQEYDDPNSTISTILDHVRQFNIPVDFPPNRLKQGFGENVIYVLNHLADQALNFNNIKWLRPERIQEVEEEETELEDEGELLLEKVEEEMAAVYSDEEEDDENVLNLEDLKNLWNQKNFKEIQKLDEVLESKIPNEVWQVELERVLPQLKVTIKTDARDWRHHLELMSKHRNEVEGNLAVAKNHLDKLHDDIANTLEKISTREKHLNTNLEPYLKQYRAKQDELSNLIQHHKSFNGRIEEKSKKLIEITEKLENVKKEIEERGSSMTDGKPLINIKKAIARIKNENKELDVRIGVLENEIFQRKFHDKTRFNPDVDAIVIHFYTKTDIIIEKGEENSYIQVLSEETRMVLIRGCTEEYAAVWEVRYENFHGVRVRN